jgi:hypothetical protein
MGGATGDVLESWNVLMLLSFQISDHLANKKNQRIETVLNRLGHVLPQSQPPQHDVFVLNYYQISEPKLDQKSCPNFPAKDVAHNQVIHRLLWPRSAVLISRLKNTVG